MGGIWPLVILINKFPYYYVKRLWLLSFAITLVFVGKWSMHAWCHQPSSLCGPQWGQWLKLRCLIGRVKYMPVLIWNWRRSARGSLAYLARAVLQISHVMLDNLCVNVEHMLPVQAWETSLHIATENPRCMLSLCAIYYSFYARALCDTKWKLMPQVLGHLLKQIRQHRHLVLVEHFARVVGGDRNNNAPIGKLREFYHPLMRISRVIDV